MGIAKNRKVSVQPGKYLQVKDLQIPDDGLLVHLKKFGQVKLFRKTFKNESERYYMMYMTDSEALKEITRREFKELHSIHWGIECASQSYQAIVWH
jgi:formamidopyrimidine-DNA glycosylase